MTPPPVRTRLLLALVLPGMEELDGRINSGWGEFIPEEEIRVRMPTLGTDLLRGVGGVGLLPNGTGVYMNRGQCPPMVYIDDVKITRCPVGGGRVGSKR